MMPYGLGGPRAAGERVGLVEYTWLCGWCSQLRGSAGDRAGPQRGLGSGGRAGGCSSRPCSEGNAGGTQGGGCITGGRAGKSAWSLSQHPRRPTLTTRQLPSTHVFVPTPRFTGKPESRAAQRLSRCLQVATEMACDSAHASCVTPAAPLRSPRHPGCQICTPLCSPVPVFLQWTRRLKVKAPRLTPARPGKAAEGGNGLPRPPDTPGAGSAGWGVRSSRPDIPEADTTRGCSEEDPGPGVHGWGGFSSVSADTAGNCWQPRGAVGTPKEESEMLPWDLGPAAPDRNVRRMLPQG